jgi:hypothetical protein
MNKIIIDNILNNSPQFIDKDNETWHPHLKRVNLNNEEGLSSVIGKNQHKLIDIKKPYEASLIQLKNRNFLKENETAPKMQCGCRFLQQDQILPAKKNILPIKKEEYPAIEIVKPQINNLQADQENNKIISFLNTNTMLMQKIENLLEMQTIKASPQLFNPYMIPPSLNYFNPLYTQPGNYNHYTSTNI